MVYVLSAPVVADATVAFDWRASTSAPLIAVPPTACVTLPVIDPVPTVNVIPLLENAPTPTTTGPLVAPEGTETTILLGLQLVDMAATPLNVTNPAVTPKLDPETLTDVPAGPDVGAMLVIVGGTLNCSPLLDAPPVVTTTEPDEAPGGTAVTIFVLFQLLTAADLPLKVTTLLP
jgi:hypothetical protein